MRLQTEDKRTARLNSETKAVEAASERVPFTPARGGSENVVLEFFRELYRPDTLFAGDPRWTADLPFARADFAGPDHRESFARR